MKSEKRNQQQQQKKRRNVVKIKANEHGEKNVHAFASNSKIFFSLFLCSNVSFFVKLPSFFSLLNGVSLCSVLNYLLDRSPLGIHYQNGNAKRNIIFTYGFSVSLLSFLRRRRHCRLILLFCYISMLLFYPGFIFHSTF